MGWCDCCGYGSEVYKPLKGKCTMCKPGTVLSVRPFKSSVFSESDSHINYKVSDLPGGVARIMNNLGRE